MTNYDWTESGYAHHLVDRIFRILFPRAGFSLRPVQLQLAHTMLDAMLHQNILLCDAGTGTGKTYAYLAAAIAASLEQAKEQLAFQPILISTSSIALQHAILQDYLPTLSQLLLSNALIDHPLHGVIRKGKAHYVCDARLERRLRCVPKRKNPKALAALRQLKQQLDMDSLPHLSAYDRRQVAIPPDCPCSRTDCRYLRFLNRCQSQDYLFHICNHNLLLADAMRRQTGKKPILPERRIVILDEAHKLPEAARQMLGITLGWKQISDFIHSLRVEHYLLAAERLEETARPVIRLLTSNGSQELSQCWGHLLELERLLGRIELQLFPLLTSETKRQLSELQAQFTLLCGQGPLRCYLVQEDSGDYLLCSHESSRGEQLNELLWKQMRSAVLTSGTLAVGKSFQCYQGETGLTGHPFLHTSIAPSPFAYQTHCLLYLPQQPPEFSGEREQSYYDQLAVEMARLIRSAHGHTLILFTSYAAITESKRRLAEETWRYPIFTMSAVNAFRESGNGILLATGSAWEGMDFPGDGVSLLIIPKLPFPFPDHDSEQERKAYPSLHAYLQEVAVPRMQRKLRQGFGRAIRTEKDTCVVAILDERAARRHRYHKQVLEALPDMPRTGSLRTVEQFYRKHKPRDYFQPGI